MKRRTERVYQGSQDWSYEAIWSGEGEGPYPVPHRLRVQIRRNAYDTQSWARCHRWDGTRWELVASRTIGECASKVVSYVQSRAEVDRKGLPAFREDADVLLAEAAMVLGVE